MVNIPILSVYDENGNKIDIPAIRGTDGITPHVGANGNWFVGETDTGVKAQGKNGNDYVLTEADKNAIAQVASGMVNVPIISVNGKTGAVTLGASDVGARASNWMPSASDVGAPTTAQFNQLSDDDKYAEITRRYFRRENFEKEVRH